MGQTSLSAEAPARKTPAAASQEWTDWRGPRRDGRVPWLPAKLSPKPNVLWEKQLTAKALGGVAATRDYVLFSDRELNDTSDAFHCADAATGKILWSHTYPAPGSLDYGNSPRATPVIHEDLVIVAGAFGYLGCLELKTGKVKWEMDIREEFKAEDERKWGMCSTPLIAEGKLIVNPGGKEASLVALDPRTGKVLWKTPGRPASYGNFVVATLGGKKQIVGHDLTTLGGWDIASGKRLWELKPALPGDFNVPTPIQVGAHLLVTTENNRTRLYQFQKDGHIDPKPLAVNKNLHNDTHTPVVVGRRVYGLHRRLFCLDLGDGLKTLWDHEDKPFNGYASILASDERLLIVSVGGEVTLLDAKADEYREISRWELFAGEQAGYAHPALVGSKLYLRGNGSIMAIELKE